MKCIDDNTFLTVVTESGDYKVAVPHYIFTDTLFDPGCTDEPTMGSLTLDIMGFLESIFDDDESIYLDDMSLKKIETMFVRARRMT